MLKHVLAICLFTSLAAEECTLYAFTLEEAEQTALEQNKDIWAMRQIVEQVRQGRLESVSKWMPEVSVISRGYATQQKVSGTGTNSAFISQFTLTQTLFSADRYYNVRISALEVEQLNLLLDALIIDVLFDVRVAYYRVILDKQNIATAKRSIEIFTQLAGRMQSNYEIGTSILLNVNQSRVAIANATAVYYQAVRQLEVDLDRLAALLGYNPGSVQLQFGESQIPIESIPDIAVKVNEMQEIFEENGVGQSAIYTASFPENEEWLMGQLYTDEEICCWETKALQCRPDLRSKYTEFKIANQEVKKRCGEYWPNVWLEANYGGYPERMMDNPSSSFFNQKFGGAVGFNIEWLLYDSCGRTYRLNQAKYARSAKSFEYSKQVQTTYEEVRKQIFDIKESIASYVTAEGNVKLAEQTLELADKQLEIGYITVFDYQSVVEGMIQAINIRDQSRFDLIAGYYGLRHASGVDLCYCR